MSLVEWAAILVVMPVKIIKTDVIVFICSFITCLTSHWLIIFSIRVSLLILTPPLSEIKGKMYKLTRKNCFRYLQLMSPLNAAICTTISYTLWVEWYYLKNNYLTLRSKVKVQRMSLRYATHRLIVMHPHTKYHWPISKDKKVMVRTSFAEKKRKKKKKKKRKKKSD